MNEKLDVKTKIGMIYCEVLFVVFLIAESLVKFSTPVFIAIIIAGVASMYLVDQICLKKGCALRKKYQK